MTHKPLKYVKYTMYTTHFMQVIQIQIASWKVNPISSHFVGTLSQWEW